MRNQKIFLKNSTNTLQRKILIIANDYFLYAGNNQWFFQEVIVAEFVRYNLEPFMN